MNSTQDLIAALSGLHEQTWDTYMQTYICNECSEDEWSQEWPCPTMEIVLQQEKLLAKDLGYCESVEPEGY